MAVKFKKGDRVMVIAGEERKRKGSRSRASARSSRSIPMRTACSSPA